MWARRRVSNEDSYFHDDAMGLYAVADGMGGHAAGEIASQEAIDTVRGMVRQGEASCVRSKVGDHSPAGAVARGPPARAPCRPPPTWCSASPRTIPSRPAWAPRSRPCSSAAPFGVTAQVGDSRIYMVREGKAAQLTEDHTLIAWQLKQGLISESEAALSPHKT